MIVTLLSQYPLSKTDYHSVGQGSAPFIWYKSPYCVHKNPHLGYIMNQISQFNTLIPVCLWPIVMLSTCLPSRFFYLSFTNFKLCRRMYPGHGTFSISYSKYYEGLKIEKDDMGGACSTCGRDAKYIQNYDQEIWRRDDLVHLRLEMNNSDSHYSQSLQVQIHE